MPLIRTISQLNVTGGRFVEIVYEGGALSVRIPDGVAKASDALFAAADDEHAMIKERAKRARILTAAAWQVLRERSGK